jgi:hypothetical protein
LVVTVSAASAEWLKLSNSGAIQDLCLLPASQAIYPRIGKRDRKFCKNETAAATKQRQSLANKKGLSIGSGLLSNNVNASGY